MNRMQESLSVMRFLEPVLGVLLPNRCIVCNGVIESGCCICSGCRSRIDIVRPPFCKRCGAPLSGVNAEAGCDQCRDLAFTFMKNESLGVYMGTLRELVHQYKFEKRRGLARTFASLILEHKRGFVEQHELLVPVPLTPARLSERGFNQASLVAERISKHSSIVLLKRCLRRRGSSKPQSTISIVSARLANLRDEFSVPQRFRDAIRGHSVLIFDDVITTGATTSACASALRSAGAATVDVLTIARVVKD